jgi:hypothetical protein
VCNIWTAILTASQSDTAHIIFASYLCSLHLLCGFCELLDSLWPPVLAVQQKWYAALAFRLFLSDFCLLLWHCA